MNARKTLIILGAICLVALLAIVALAIYLLQKKEDKANADRTKPAREAAIKKAEERKRQQEAGTNEEDFKTLESLADEGSIKVD